ncbi:MAG: hypothetical protein GXP24_12560 [Planctomycetes bacterium]|nr:hypothetical protein [Planctomycetota bacterium]
MTGRNSFTRFTKLFTALLVFSRRLIASLRNNWRRKLAKRQAVGFGRRLVFETVEPRRMLSANSLVVTLTNADFDENNTIDAADLASWEGNFGTATGAEHGDGDADGNGSVNGFDFLAWQRGFGSTSPDPLGILTIDDTQSGVDQIIVSVVDIAGTDFVAVNGLATSIGADRVDALKIFGGNGDDLIDLSAVDTASFPNLVDGEVTIDAGFGNDTVTGSALSDTIWGGFGNDVLLGQGGNDTLRGGWGFDVLEGGIGDDLLDGGLSGDTYRFSGSEDLGTDTLFEAIGDGNDTLDFAGLDTGIALDLASSIATEVATGRVWLSALDVLEIENVIGTELVDDITGNALANQFDGLGGNDTLRGNGGDDLLSGGEGDDQLFGGDGNDTILGGSGSDYGEGGPGDDESDLGDDDTSPPEIEAIPPLEVRKDETRGIRILADDLDHDYTDLSFTLQAVAGNPTLTDLGVSISSDGQFSWFADPTNSAGPLPGTYQVEVTVTDPDGLTESQTLTLNRRDYNDEPPALSTLYAWFDGYEPDPLVTPPIGFWNGQGATGVYARTILVDILHPDFSGIMHPGSFRNSVEFSLQVNPYLSENAGETSFDSQTANEDLTYRLISGPGSMDASGLYTWDISYTDGGETYRLVFEVEDDGSADGGEIRTSQGYLFVQVILFEGDFTSPIQEPPVAIDREYSIGVDQTIAEKIWTFNGGNGIYNPIFHDFYTGDYAATFTLNNPSNGTVTLDDDSDGSFTYTPNPGFIGVDSFTYTIEHYTGDFDENDIWLTSNEGEITIAVGPRYVSDLDTSVPDEDENDPPGEYVVWNQDDDNDNGIEDYLDINGPVQGEDDLVEISIGPFFRDDQYLLDYRFEFDVLGVRLWDSADKQFEIVHNTQYLQADLPDTVYAENFNDTGGLVWLKILHSGLFVDPGGIDNVATDKVLFSGVSADLDIDSDNNNGFALPDGSAWEEELEDNTYGLGKLVLQNYGTDDPGEDAQSFTPIVFRLSTGLDPNLQLRIDYNPLGTAGFINLWKANKSAVDPLVTASGTPQAGTPNAANGGLLVTPNTTYTLSDLDYCSQCGEVVLWISAWRENPLTKTLRGVEENGKPEEFITATLVQNGRDVASDEVKYIVTQPDSFFYQLQNSRQVRTGLASRGVYGREDLPNFSLKSLSNNDLFDLQVPLSVRQLLLQDSGVNGFNAVLYQDYIAGGDNQYVLAFAGTDDLLDIIDDLAQGLGRFSGQYASAIEIGRQLGIVVQAGNIAGLVATGHSLGGGLASAASLAGGIVADTFNAAGLHANTIALIANPISVPINAYYVDWDGLSFAQDNLPFMPSALGTRIPMDGPHDFDVAAGILLGSLLNVPAVGVGTLVVGSALVEAHKIPSVLYGLLVDEATDTDLLGLGEEPYDF